MCYLSFSLCTGTGGLAHAMKYRTAILVTTRAPLPRQHHNMYYPIIMANCVQNGLCSSNHALIYVRTHSTWDECVSSPRTTATTIGTTITHTGTEGGGGVCRNKSNIVKLSIQFEVYVYVNVCILYSWSEGSQ